MFLAKRYFYFLAPLILLADFNFAYVILPLLILYGLTIYPKSGSSWLKVAVICSLILIVPVTLYDALGYGCFLAVLPFFPILDDVLKGF